MKRLAHRNPTVQLFALSLSESLGKNLGVNVHREMASRAFTQGLEKLITDRVSNHRYGFQLSPDMTSEFERILMKKCEKELWG